MLWQPVTEILEYVISGREVAWFGERRTSCAGAVVVYDSGGIPSLALKKKTHGASAFMLIALRPGFSW
jgi:hypothetical protein